MILMYIVKIVALNETYCLLKRLLTHDTKVCFIRRRMRFFAPAVAITTDRGCVDVLIITND